MKIKLLTLTLSLTSFTAAKGAIILNEFNFNPDGLEYVVLSVTSSPEDLSDYSYTFSGGETLLGGTFSLSNSSLTLNAGESVVISRLPQVAFDIIHAVNSSAVGAFVYNSELDLSSNFNFTVTNNSASTSTPYSVAAAAGATCCIIGPDGVTYIDCDRPLTANSSFTATGTPAYLVPEPTATSLLGLGILGFTLRRSRDSSCYKLFA